MASISLPTGSYAMPDPRASVRRLVNCFAESAPQISQDDDKNKDTPVILRRAPGITSWVDLGDGGPVRGLHNMKGVLYAVSGDTLYRVDPNGFITNLGSGITGSGIVRMADNGNCICILNPGTAEAWVYIPNNVLLSTSFTLNVSSQPAPAPTYLGSITPSQENSFAPIGYQQGSYGTLAPSTWGSQTITDFYYWGNNNTTTLVISGFTSDPTQTYVGSVTSNNVVLFGPNATYAYDATSTTASWSWNQFPGLSAGKAAVLSIAPTTTPPPSGATSGILSYPWPYWSQSANILFSDGETREASFVQTSPTVSWADPLAGSPTTATSITFLSNFSQLQDPTFLEYGAQDLGFIDTYIVFLALNGVEFYNSDSPTVSFNGFLTFTGASEFVREYGTDLFVGMSINNRQVIMLGQLTSEIYIDAGNTEGSPFSSAPNNFMEIGCASTLSIAKQNLSVIWLANDRTVRVLNGLYPVRVSNSGIEAVLEQADITGAYALSYSIAGHLFYSLTLPVEGRTLVYDCLTGEWHELTSPGMNYWSPLSTLSCYDMWLVGDSQSGQIGYLDTMDFTEFGNYKTAEWIHQPIYSGHNRLQHMRLEAVLGTGKGPLTGQGSCPLLTLQISDDGGNTFRTMPTKSLGTTGNYLTRAVWYRLGMSRERVYKFTLADPYELWLTDVQLEASPALH